MQAQVSVHRTGTFDSAGEAKQKPRSAVLALCRCALPDGLGMTAVVQRRAGGGIACLPPPPPAAAAVRRVFEPGLVVYRVSRAGESAAVIRDRCPPCRS